MFKKNLKTSKRYHRRKGTKARDGNMCTQGGLRKESLTKLHKTSARKRKLKTYRVLSVNWTIKTSHDSTTNSSRSLKFAEAW